MTQPLGHPKPEKKVVDLTIYIKDGHLVDPGRGGERHIIGKAEVYGTQVALILNDVLPDGVMDAIAGTSGPVPMSLGFTPPVVLPPATPFGAPPGLWDWHKQP